MMLSNLPDSNTVFALSSGGGQTGVAVIRISGPLVPFIVKKLTGIKDPKPRYAHLQSIYATLPDAEFIADPTKLIDQTLLLYFPAPHSFTGEDVVEFHTHGSRAVIDKLNEVLLHYAKPAAAGEFTKRAFLNNKMDLTAVEGLGDLIHAETELQRRQALRQMQGGLAEIYDDWREQLIKIMAYMEAYIDFPDEDLPADVYARLQEQQHQLITLITEHLNDQGRGERVREGLYIALIGPPNAGKSTLLNLLSAKEAAIVADEAGTTRDVIETYINMEGALVTLADTAGIREHGADRIELEGIKRARKTADQADMVIILADICDMNALQDMQLDQMALPDQCIVLANKTDQSNHHGNDLEAQIKAMLPPALQTMDVFPISLLQGDGVEQFQLYLRESVKSLTALSAQPSLTRQRHRIALMQTVQALQASLKAPELELQAEDLRHAIHHLSAITGRVDIEEILDVVFKDFCIGK